MSKNITISAVPHGAEALIVAGLTAQTILHISASDREMSRFIAGMNFFAPDVEIIKFPAWDTLPYEPLIAKSYHCFAAG